MATKYLKNLTGKGIHITTTYKGKTEEFDIPHDMLAKLEWAEDDQGFKNIIKQINKNVVETDENGNEI